MRTHDGGIRNLSPVLRPALWAGGLLFALAGGAFAQASGLSYILQPGSALWITGDSTLHAWGSTATQVELAATFDAAQAVSADGMAKGALKALGVRQRDAGEAIKEKMT